jgi:hypothetical protein
MTIPSLLLWLVAANAAPSAPNATDDPPAAPTAPPPTAPSSAPPPGAATVAPSSTPGGAPPSAAPVIGSASGSPSAPAPSASEATKPAPAAAASGSTATAAERIDTAEAAWKRGDLEAAEAAFLDATRIAPTEDRAWRRLCGVVLAQSRTVDAISHCRAALALAQSVENRTALALALIRDVGGVDPSTSPNMEEARTLLDAAAIERPDYLQVWAGLCEWARLADDLPTAERCVGNLERLEPQRTGTLYYRAQLDAAKGDWASARKALVAARNAGLTDDLYQPLAGRISAATTTHAPGEAGPDEAASPATTIADLLPWLIGAGLLISVAGVALMTPSPSPDEATSTPPGTSPPDSAEAPVPSPASAESQEIAPSSPGPAHGEPPREA